MDKHEGFVKDSKITQQNLIKKNEAEMKISSDKIKVLEAKKDNLDKKISTINEDFKEAVALNKNLLVEVDTNEKELVKVKLDKEKSAEDVKFLSEEIIKKGKEMKKNNDLIANLGSAIKGLVNNKNAIIGETKLLQIENNKQQEDIKSQLVEFEEIKKKQQLAKDDIVSLLTKMSDSTKDEIQKDAKSLKAIKTVFYDYVNRGIITTVEMQDLFEKNNMQLVADSIKDETKMFTKEDTQLMIINQNKRGNIASASGFLLVTGSSILARVLTTYLSNPNQNVITIGGRDREKRLEEMVMRRNDSNNQQTSDDGFDVMRNEINGLQNKINIMEENMRNRPHEIIRKKLAKSKNVKHPINIINVNRMF